MTDMFLALAVAFAVSAGLAPAFIPYLRKLKFGQSILEIGPSWHKSKQGTPTMGGILFIFGTAVAMGIFCRDQNAWLAFGMAALFGLIGFFDDYLKVVKKRNLGLKAGQKMLLQILAAVAYLLSLRWNNVITTAVLVPFTDFALELNWLFYPFAVFVIVGTVNAVNLTDGIDGLAAGVTVPVCIFFSALSFVFMAPGLGVLSAAITGALFGFLIYNFHPAKVFMGDTGSLFLGGLISALAFAFNVPIILILVGLVYVWEALSDIIQVVSFKSTGKRVFKMAPFHHHLEKCGWSEVKIVYVFVIITVLMCVLSFFALQRYFL